MNMDTLLQADTDLLLALNGSSSQFVDGLMMALTSGFTWIPMYVASCGKEQRDDGTNRTRCGMCCALRFAC